VKHLLEASADKVLEMQGANWTQYHGYGRINAYRALQFLSSPYTVTQSTVVGGTATLTWGSHTTHSTTMAVVSRLAFIMA
jgi:hypothetical protein